MYRFAIVEEKSRQVTNIVIWNERSRWMSIPGTWVIQSDEAAIGDRYDPEAKKFSKKVNG